MAKNNLFNDMSIESILSDVKRMTGEETKPEKIWSLDEIDALLSDEVPQKNSESILSKDSDGAENRQEEPIMQVEHESLKTASAQKTESGLGLKEFAMKNALVQNEDEQETAPEENVADEGEIEPLIETVCESEEETVEAELPEENGVEGQISIEKTRVFNEVEARAVRDEKISHHIGNAKIITSASSPSKMESDPYRERFLNKPKLDIEKTQDHREMLKDLPAKTIEKHGVVVKKPSHEKTSADGLSPIPILVDAADEYDAQIKLEKELQSGVLKSNSFEEDENQIMLDGYDDREEAVIVSEAEEEEKLRKIRKDKASKFRLFPNIEVDSSDVYGEEPNAAFEEAYEKTKAVNIPDDIREEETVPKDEIPDNPKKKKRKTEKVNIAREFFGPKDAKAVYEILVGERSSAKRKIIVSALAVLILLFASVMASSLGNFSMFSESPLIYSAGNLIVLLCVGAVNYKSVFNAFEQIAEKKITSDTAVTVCLIVGIIQCTVSFFFGELVLSGTHIYAAASVFPVLMINTGEYIKAKNDVRNFSLVNKEQNSSYAVRKIEDDGIAFEVGRGLMIKDPDIRYNAKVNFPYKFVEMTKIFDPTADTFKLMLPVVLLASVIVGIVSAIVNGNLFIGVTSFTGTFVMAVPSASVIACYYALKNTNKKLNAENGLISGYEAVENALESNAVIVDAKDLFSNEAAYIYGIKLFNSMRIDEAILYTAAVVIQSEGALSDEFDSIILSKREMLPQVESLAYEERLGCSGWIYNYRVLVGNRDLLAKHNVEVQSKEEESIFTRSGKQVLYLAVEGKIAAMFVVGYSANSETAQYMREIEKAGISILVRTTDANITEELVEQYFGLPRNFIKVISPVASLMFNEMSKTQAINEPCRILHNGTLNSFLYAFASALNLSERKKLINILQGICVGIGIVIMAMFSFLSGISQAGNLQIILFEGIWAVIMALVPQIKKIKRGK